MKKYIREIRLMFANDADEIAKKNWSLMRTLTLVYMFCLAIYFLTVCMLQGNALHSYAVIAAFTAQALFSVLLWSAKKTPSPRTVSVLIIVFSSMIMTLAIFVGIFACPGEAALLFPLLLIMQTQFYTLKPLFMLPILCINTIAFITLSLIFKNQEFVVLDLTATAVSLTIAFAAYCTALYYKAESYDKQCKLNQICSVDQLTGILNKSAFYAAYDTVVSSEEHQRIAVAILDIDNFKRANDTLGHIYGDIILKRLGSTLKYGFSSKVADMTVARFGGDEFVILFTGDFDKDATSLFERLLISTRQLGREFGADIACSIGVVINEGDPTDLNSLMGIADGMLYEIKHDGGNDYRVTTRGKSALITDIPCKEANDVFDSPARPASAHIKVSSMRSESRRTSCGKY